jgi:hypothetical protein
VLALAVGLIANGSGSFITGGFAIVAVVIAGCFPYRIGAAVEVITAGC